ncbi:MAG: hypothetical protein K9H14_03960 [Actinomycetia bacterium]|nr:hypothetical protein [Actinomycetes bacterium]
MTKKSIIIIIVCTFILIAISVTTVYKEPKIKGIYVSSQNNMPENSILDPLFSSDSITDIFLLIEAENLKLDNMIEVSWKKYEDGDYIAVQHDTIYPENSGSGIITITMVKRNGLVPEGKYRVSVNLVNHPVLTTEFEIE